MYKYYFVTYKMHLLNWLCFLFFTTMVYIIHRVVSITLILDQQTIKSVYQTRARTLSNANICIGVRKPKVGLTKVFRL